MTCERDLLSLFLCAPYDAHELIFGLMHDSPSPGFHEVLVDLMWFGPEQAGAAIFREGGKSTRAEEMLVLGVLLRRFHYAVIIGANEDRAKARLHKIKYSLESNPRIQAIFGDIRGDSASVWQEKRIIVGGDRSIEAFGTGSSVRGMKFLDYRPDFVLIDDLEEMSRYFDNVSTPEKRTEVWDWLHGDFLPIVQKGGRKFIIGSVLHEDGVMARMIRSRFWRIMVVPVETISEDGARVPQWGAKFPLEWIDEKRKEYLEAGVSEIFEREYMCRPVSERARSFKRGDIVFEVRRKTIEPCYVIYDPARTVNSNSCGTGKVVASWFGGKIYVWEAKRYFWQPDEIIDDIFRSDKEYCPIAIGVEVTGLNEFIEQPMRRRTIETGRPIPFRRLNPPRGPGKDGFILGLQPFFAAKEVVFCGQEEDFKEALEELLGFPYGMKDIINALAYMVTIRPGIPVFPEFDSLNVVHLSSVKDGPRLLALGTDGGELTGVLCYADAGGLVICNDWVCGEGTGAVPQILAEARVLGGKDPVCYAGEEHFSAYDAVGLRAACNSAGVRLMKGAPLPKGREALRRMIRLERGRLPLLRVSRDATWTIRAFSGGYCFDADKRDTQRGVYRVLMESLESMAGMMEGSEEMAGVRWQVGKDGSRFISAQVTGRR